MSAIAIGSDAINRNAAKAATDTIIDLNVPATATGFITQVLIWAVTAITGMRVGTFYLVSGTTYKCRASVSIGDVAAGSALPFAVSIAVVVGDFIGAYWAVGTMEYSNNLGATGIVYKAGEYIDPGDSAAMTAVATRALSLSGTGVLPVDITTTTLPGGEVSAAYSQALAASGGTTPYTWTLDSGALPDNLSLSAAGVISGTPTVAGTFNFTVKVTDSSPTPLTDTQALSIVIAAAPNITTTTLPAGEVGAAYSQNLAASGGTAPYVWSLVSGSLPDSLSLGSDGVISGTPTVAGAFTFTVRATDSFSPAVTDDQELSITVSGGTPVVTTNGHSFFNKETTKEYNDKRVAYYVGAIPANSPALFCPAIHGRGGSLLDRSKNANTGTIAGATWTRLPSGLWVLSFDGSNDQVTFAEAASLKPAQLTVIVWIKHSVTTRYVISKDYVSDNPAFALDVQTNNIRWIIKYAASSYVAASGVNTGDGVWHCIVGDYDLANLHIYVDNVLKATTVGGSAIDYNAAARSLRLGSLGGSANFWFTGLIGMPQIYPAALADAERTRLFTRQRHLFGV